MTTTSYRSGDILFSEGDPVEGVLSVRHGTVDVLRRRNGVEILLGTVSPGQFLGEMSVVEHRARRSATARAGSGCEVELIGGPEFLALISDSPQDARADRAALPASSRTRGPAGRG